MSVQSLSVLLPHFKVCSGAARYQLLLPRMCTCCHGEPPEWCWCHKHLPVHPALLTPAYTVLWQAAWRAYKQRKALWLAEQQELAQQCRLQQRGQAGGPQQEQEQAQVLQGEQQASAAILLTGGITCESSPTVLSPTSSQGQEMLAAGGSPQQSPRPTKYTVAASLRWEGEQATSPAGSPRVQQEQQTKWHRNLGHATSMRSEASLL